MKYRLLLKLLWNNQSKWQFLFAVGGFIAGLFTILSSLQLYVDIKTVVAKNEADRQKEYLIIHKQVTLANTFNKGTSAFSSSELDTLRKQPFIQAVAPFETSTFQVQANLQMQFGFTADLFFEAIPDEYIDNRPEPFQWQEGSDFVPIIIANEFLNVYNFGVAMSSALPQLPKEAVQMFPFQIKLSGRGKEDVFNARVIGFSDRIPTVLVPLSFMKWANKTYGKTEHPPPQRLLLEVIDKDDPRFKALLAEKGYITNQELLKTDNTRKILQIILSIVTGAGVLFIALSCIIFLVSFQLLIARARYELDVLLNLGYSPSIISHVLNAQLLIILAISSGAVLASVAYVFRQLHALMIARGIVVEGKLSPLLMGTTISILLMLLLLNYTTLRAALRR